MNHLFQIIPEYHARVWGGDRLQPGAPQPVGEAWMVYEHNRIAAGAWAGRTLGEAAHALGASLLGERVHRQFGGRFPVLIKILDCHDWLSVQVHPNDAQAVALEGAGQFGKTEAWFMLEAAPGARLIAGVKPGTAPEALAAAIRAGTILDWVQYHTVSAGDMVFMPAGTLHALGPGVLLYEIQQTSDITYRVFDWNRPASAGRKLHIEQSVAVTEASATAPITPLPALSEEAAHTLVTCPYFKLDLLTLASARALDTGGESFHALTVTSGEVTVSCGDERVTLREFESVIVPANVGVYRVEARGEARVLVARV